MAAPAIETYVAMDAEMILTRAHKSEGSLALARIGIVDYQGHTLLDSLVHVPHAHIANYNTSASGIRPFMLETGETSPIVGEVGEGTLMDWGGRTAPSFDEVRMKVREAVKGKVVVGHALFNDLAVLKLRLPHDKIRDTALYYPIRALLDVKAEGQYPGLKHLAKLVLETDIQGGMHDPVVDARITMLLYQKYRDDWEKSLAKYEDVTAAIPGHYSNWYY